MAELDVDALEEAFDDIEESLRTIRMQVRKLRETFSALTDDESEDE